VRPVPYVADRPGDRPVPVETDEDKVQDGGGAEKDIGGKPELTENVAEHPVAHEFIGEGERHDEETDEEVADCQGGDEPILDATEVTINRYSHDHEHVTHNYSYHDHRNDHGRYGDVNPPVSTRVGGVVVHVVTLRPNQGVACNPPVAVVSGRPHSKGSDHEGSVLVHEIIYVV